MSRSARVHLLGLGGHARDVSQGIRTSPTNKRFSATGEPWPDDLWAGASPNGARGRRGLDCSKNAKHPSTSRTSLTDSLSHSDDPESRSYGCLRPPARSGALAALDATATRTALLAACCVNSSRRNEGPARRTCAMI